MAYPAPFVGVMLNLLSQILSMVGLLLQKVRAHHRRHARHGPRSARCAPPPTLAPLPMLQHSAHVDEGKPVIIRWRFWIGFALNAGSELAVTSVSLVMAPLSLLIAFGGFSVIFNGMLSHFGFLKCVQHYDHTFFGAKAHSAYDTEKLKPKDWYATLIVLLGATLVSISGPGSVEAASNGTALSRGPAHAPSSEQTRGGIPAVGSLGLSADESTSWEREGGTRPAERGVAAGPVPARYPPGNLPGRLCADKTDGLSAPAAAAAVAARAGGALLSWEREGGSRPSAHLNGAVSPVRLSPVGLARYRSAGQGERSRWPSEQPPPSPPPRELEGVACSTRLSPVRMVRHLSGQQPPPSPSPAKPLALLEAATQVPAEGRLSPHRLARQRSRDRVGGASA